ncbi:tetratricopeptide repeat-containing diguanylate cyclase [Thiolapillus brandeum]|uniref:tetratricopeptide repeat-containing diguanylate cyclase n=1 Tax=Thiolapillus brandeum TaxID=1076588 RepID=UPI0005979AD3|nr:tetratricopeptide repeat-containing diguanylate cyclase [Thiolapillus brandeum]
MQSAESKRVEKIELLIEQAVRLREDDSARAIELCDEAIALAKKIEASELSAQASVLLAQALLYNGRSQEALDTALRLVNSTGQRSKTLKADALDTLALVYDTLGAYQDSLQIRLEQLDILQQLEDDLGIANVLHAIGVAYARMDDHAKSLENYEQAYRLKQSLGASVESQAKTLNNIGLANRNLKNFEASLAAHIKAVQMMEQENSLFLSAAARGNLARVQEEIGDVESAVQNYESALKTMQETSSRYFLSELFRNYAELEVRQKNNQHAIELCQKALDLGYEMGMKPEIFKAHHLLAEIHESLDAFPEALHHLRRFHAVEKEVYNAESEARIQNMRVLHELERAQQESKIYRLKNVELAEALEKAEQLQRMLEKQSLEDQLTGLHNRRHLNQRLQVEFDRTRRHQQPLSLVLCDIDHFKQVNDRFSHAMGDEVLKVVANILIRHDVLTCPTSTNVDYAGVGKYTPDTEPH